MYCEYFGLRQYPFALTPDTANFYQGGNRGAILNSLRYAVARGDGLIKVVGEVGSGKTMLCRMLAAILPSDTDSVYLDNPGLGPEQLLAAIFAELGLRHEGPLQRVRCVNYIKEELIRRHRAGRRVLLLVEEAQTMSLASLEELRLLSNLETAHSKLLQIVLFGQPELDQKLLHYNIRQLRDRIVHSFYLTPLSRDDVNRYIQHRLRRAGFQGPNYFTRPAINGIAHASHGLMRRINVITDKVLLAAYAGNTRRITRSHVRAAVRDSLPPATAHSAVSYLVAGGLLLLAAMTAGWQQLGTERTLAWLAPVYALLAPATGADAASLPLLTARQQAAATRLRHPADADFSIQLLTAEADAAPRVEDFLRQAATAGVTDDIFVQQTATGRYLVLYREFTDWRQAAAELRSLPPALAAGQPIVRTLRSVRQQAN